MPMPMPMPMPMRCVPCLASDGTTTTRCRTIPVHMPTPCAPGFTGALLNALQLLPVGRLDGGRLATAALGQRSHPPVSIVPGVVVTAATAQGCCLQGCCLHAPPPRRRQQPQPLGP